MTPTRPPVLLSLEDLPRYAAADRRLELVDGSLFVSPLETPYLEAVLSRIERTIDLAARRTDAALRLRLNEPLVISPSTVLVPDLQVGRDGERPLVVIEVRTESTERYALGPKRLVYARAGIAEYWFVDPRARRVAFLGNAAGEPDYAWPPLWLGPGDIIPSRVLRGPIAARDLTG